jgi:hypothetical protein
MKNISLTEEQKKIFKRVEILAKSHRSKDGEVLITFDRYQGSGFEEAWTAGELEINTTNGRQYESYPPYYDLIKSLVFDNEHYFQEPFDNFDDSFGTIEAIYNINEKVLRFNADIRYYEPAYSERDIEFSEEETTNLINIKNSRPNLQGNTFRMRFDGGGDSGYLADGENDAGDQVDIPSVFEDLGYKLLEDYFGGWEINEGSYGSIVIDFSDPENVTAVIEMNMNEESSEYYEYNFTVSAK